jgi:alpha-glucosidase
MFAPEQPDFNWDNREVQLDFLKTLKFWSDRGVDGFRIDVAHALKKDFKRFDKSYTKIDSMNVKPDGKDILFDRDDVHAIYKEWRKLFNQYNPPRVAVAEAYVPAARRTLYATPEELGQAFNFDLLGTYFSAKDYKRVVTENIELAAESGSSSTWVLNNHDQVRTVTKFGLPKGTDYNQWLLTDGKSIKVDIELGQKRARAAAMFIMSLPGATYIYQGEELGLFEVADLKPEDLQDPNWKRNIVRKPQRAFFKKQGKMVTGVAEIHIEKGRDGCRVPLPWTSTGSSFGFGSGKAHLPQPREYGPLSMQAQSKIKGSTLDIYRTALKLRKKLQTTEEFEWMKTGDPQVLHLSRKNGWHCITNFDGADFTLPKGEILHSSSPLKGRKLPKNTTVWLKA